LETLAAQVIRELLVQAVNSPVFLEFGCKLNRSLYLLLEMSNFFAATGMVGERTGMSFFVVREDSLCLL